MILFKKSKELGTYLDMQRKKGLSIGFVPTMGALHQGHISLAENSKKDNAVTVASIFVNPAQFNDQKDFDKYPVSIAEDIQLLEEAGCNVLFLPSVKEIYPDGTASIPNYPLGQLETIFEGKFRPGHFQGVCMVVHRLLDIVNPDMLYLGQKDYQQCMVISRLTTIIGKQDTTRIVICPTVREEDGLAMSSRNRRLNEQERKKAVILYECLSEIKKKLSPGSVKALKEEAIKRLASNGFKVDYVALANAHTLEEVEHWDGKTQLVALIAAFNNEVRLIDNMLM